MKLGILTFHRAHNYGAVLQTYALQEALRGLGHEVRVIDFRQPDIENAYRLPSMRDILKGLARHPRSTYHTLRRMPIRKERKRNFERFVSEHLCTTTPCLAESIPQDFDAYVIGSDQLWNVGCTGGKFERVYLGDFHRPEGVQLYGYAISSHLESFDQLGEQTLREVVARFDALSFREAMSAKVAGCITDSTFPVCCDPTLLVDASAWKPLVNDKYKNRRYVLTYQVRGAAKLLREKAEALAAQLGCEVIDASTYEHSVEDFVSLFKHAQYVVTTSFHGTVFAVIFGHPLYSIRLNDGHDGRYVNLLNQLGATQMCVDRDFDPQPIEVDYAPIQQALSALRQQSLDFLRGIR